MNLIDNTLFVSAKQAMKDVFDSFKRDEKIKIYFAPDEVYIADSNYNADFQQSLQSAFLTQTPVYEECEARIIFLDNQPSEAFVGGGGELNLKVRQNYGRMKIQVELAGYNLLKDAKQVIYQNDKYIQEGDVRKVGILGEIQFYSIIYSKIT